MGKSNGPERGGRAETVIGIAGRGAWPGWLRRAHQTVV